MRPQRRFRHGERAAKDLFHLGDTAEQVALRGVRTLRRDGDQPQLPGPRLGIRDALAHRKPLRSARRRQPRAEQRVVQRREEHGERGVRGHLRPGDRQRGVERDQRREQGNGAAQGEGEHVRRREQIHERLQRLRELRQRQHGERADESLLERVPGPALLREPPARHRAQHGCGQQCPGCGMRARERTAEQQDAHAAGRAGERREGRPAPCSARPRRHRSLELEEDFVLSHEPELLPRRLLQRRVLERRR